MSFIAVVLSVIVITAILGAIYGAFIEWLPEGELKDFLNSL